MVVLIAGLRILEARANLGIAIGEQYPQLQEAKASLIYSNQSKNTPNLAFADRNFWDLKLGFDTAWELDFWGRFRRGIESASASMNASITNYDDILVSLTAEVARDYVLIRTLEELIEVTQHNVAIQQRSYEIANVQFIEGAVSELDPQQAMTPRMQKVTFIFVVCQWFKFRVNFSHWYRMSNSNGFFADQNFFD